MTVTAVKLPKSGAKLKEVVVTFGVVDVEMELVEVQPKV
jgi:hypothetical protein